MPASHSGRCWINPLFVYYLDGTTEGWETTRWEVKMKKLPARKQQGVGESRCPGEVPTVGRSPQWGTGQKRCQETVLVLTRFLGRNVALLAHSIHVETLGRKFGDLPSTASGKLDIEDLRAHHAASRAFIHGKEMPLNPIPSVITMRVVDADHDFQLGLSPEARTIRRWKSNSGIEFGQLEFAVFAIQLDSGLVIGIFPEIIIGQKFEASFLCTRHFVFRLKLHPIAARRNTIFFSLIRAHRAILREQRNCCQRD